jgi:CheY-like chemotaxis protein
MSNVPGASATAPAAADLAAAGKSVLIVEDELMIRMLLEDMLSELGYRVVAQAGRLDEASTAARQAAYDIAILDLNLDGQSTLAVADLIAARGKPYVFATGYGEQGLPPSHRHRPTLRKPFQLEGLRDTLARALAQQGELPPARPA